MNKKVILAASMLIIMLMSALSMSAQSPVKWKATSKMVSSREGIITVTGTIDKGWHVYAFTQPADGPNAMTLNMTGTKGVTFKGVLKSKPTPTSLYEEMFGAKVSYWENKVTFTRRFRLSKVSSASATITINYMCCNDQSCRPPCTETLTVKIK